MVCSYDADEKDVGGPKRGNPESIVSFLCFGQHSLDRVRLGFHHTSSKLLAAILVRQFGSEHLYLLDLRRLSK